MQYRLMMKFHAVTQDKYTNGMLVDHEIEERRKHLAALVNSSRLEAFLKLAGKSFHILVPWKGNDFRPYSFLMAGIGVPLVEEDLVLWWLESGLKSSDG